MRLPARDGDGGDAGEVDRDREDIREVHRERVALFLQPERNRGHRGPGNHIDLSKDTRKILFDVLAGDLRLGIILPVIARGEGIGAEHDTAPHFGAKASLPHIPERLVPRLLRISSGTIPHAVKPCEVRARLAGAGDIIRGKGVLHRRDAAGDRGSPEFHEPANGLVDHRS